MVVGTPYVHFTINNEPPEAEVDYTYTWATTVEATKGPVNQPTLVSSAAQAQAIFGVDMRPYFAQGAESLIIVRVAALNAVNAPQKGTFSFITEKDIIVYRVQQSTVETKTSYSFVSYGDAEGQTQWAQGVVEPTGTTSGDFTEVKVIENSIEGFENQKFFIKSDIVADGTTIYPLYTEANPSALADIYVSVRQNRKYIHKLYYTLNDAGKVVVLIQERNASGTLIPNSFIDAWNDDGTRTNDANAYITATPYCTPVRHTITKGTPLFNVTTKYEGDYGITVSVNPSPVNPYEKEDDFSGSYDIVLTDPSLGSIKMSHVYDVKKIVNRINDAGLNFVAQATNAGMAISEAMNASASYINTYNDTDFVKLGITDDLLIKNDTAEGIFILTCIDKNENVSYCTKEDIDAINLYKDGTITEVDKEILNYQINLQTVFTQPLLGASNGEWDATEQRIPSDFRGDAHAAGLKLLRRMRIAGIFCMYEDNSIQIAYQSHGKDPHEPEKGMNNNETCKWRTIILGASHKRRSSQHDLAEVASALNDQYILLLGHGLIDTGFNGVGASLTPYERKTKYGLYDAHQLLPCECTQYIAGLRSKLNYDESIFGGQGRKRIRSVGELKLAPLFDYQEEYEWDPRVYTYLNESGVLTFTEEYGNITLTDGVTTCQKGFEEDEEGVMNILKYAQNSVYNVCLPYIGRNINSDLEQSITMDIQGVLDTMRDYHQSIVDTEEYPAYTINVSLGSRANQLLGRIYIYLTITPAHALRQVEVEMTVQ